MLRRIPVFLAVLGLLILSSGGYAADPPNAGQQFKFLEGFGASAVEYLNLTLWPMHVGRWFEWDKQDNTSPTPHAWVVRADVLRQVTFNGRQYFLVREQNYDPYEGKIIKRLLLLLRIICYN
jgi:hypothetical protein